MRDPALRARILAEADALGASGDCLPARLTRSTAIFPLGDPPDYEPPRRTVDRARAPRARAAIRAELAYDLLLEQRRPRASCSRRSPTTPTTTSTCCREMLRQPAHADRAWATAAPTSASISRRELHHLPLTHWGRDRARGRLAGRAAGQALRPRDTAARRRPERPRRARAGHEGRPQRDRLRPAARRRARDGATTCRPAGGGCCRGPRLRRDDRGRAVTYRDGEATGRCRDGWCEERSRRRWRPEPFSPPAPPSPNPPRRRRRPPALRRTTARPAPRARTASRTSGT